MDLWPVTKVQTSGLNTADMSFHVEWHICHSEDHGDRKLLVTEEPVWAVGNESGPGSRHYRMDVHLVWHLLPRLEHPGACLQDPEHLRFWQKCGHDVNVGPPFLFSLS